MNLYEAKTPLLGKGGVAAPSRKMARRHLVWRGRGGSFKLQLESVRRLNEPPRVRPAKVASRHFVDGRSHPSFAALHKNPEWEQNSPPQMSAPIRYSNLLSERIRFLISKR